MGPYPDLGIWDMNRRTFLSTLLIAFLAAPSGAQEMLDDGDIEELLSEIEALSASDRVSLGALAYDAETRSVIRQNGVKSEGALPKLSAKEIEKVRASDYWRRIDRPAPVWPDDQRAPDYAHLAPLGRPAPVFTLAADTLKTLADRNDFSLSARPFTVFGLRGCRIAQPLEAADWTTSVRLEVTRPDHVTSRCVIGLWRRSDNQLLVFRGSTVPAVRHVYMSLAVEGRGASLLPTGLYTYRSGDHLAGYPDKIQRAALRIQKDYAVLRTTKSLAFDPYETTSYWSNGAAHNIHAGGSADRFSCAGCQVIPGGYSGKERLTPAGDWARFQKALGLVGADGRFAPVGSLPTFDYMLLTGDEAALASEGALAFSNGYRRLRPGSSGQRVARLQRRLISRHSGQIPSLKETGAFDLMTSMGALLEAKRTTREYTTPIVISA